MPMMELNLEQLLKTIEQLESAELAILHKRITQHSISVKTPTEKAQRDKFFTLSFN